MRAALVVRGLAVLLITLLAAGPAAAALVSVTGGFTSFSSSAVFGTSATAYARVVRVHAHDPLGYGGVCWPNDC